VVVGMPRFDPSNVPPRYPKADKETAARRRYGKAMVEYRRVQGSPLTHGRFNLYSSYGRVFLGLMFALNLGLAVVIVQLILERPPRYWDEWVLRFAGPFVPITLPIIFCLMYRSHRRIYRLANNQCPACGYDLRESPERCPECGLNV
jgi:hypothetical protein